MTALKPGSRLFLALLLCTALTVSPAAADVLDADDDEVTNEDLCGEVTSVTTDGDEITEIGYTAGGANYTINGDGGDKKFLDDLEKAFDHENRVYITTDGHGNIDTMRREHMTSTTGGGTQQLPGNGLQSPFGER